MMKRHWVVTTITLSHLSSICSVHAANINIVKLRELDHPKAAQGDIAGTVTASGGNSNSAKYTVTGDAGKSYVVAFPNGNINMTGPGANIQANTFTSSSTGGYVLDGTGKDTLYVGATRAALPGGQTTGNYSRSFNTRVQYTTGGKTAQASTTSAVTVIATLGIAKVADLQFGEAAQGAIAKTINPASDSGRAQFTVTGQASTAYSVTLPADGATKMITAGGGGVTKEISVDTFASNPTSPATLPPAGPQTLYVGATRAAVRTDQVPGAYTTSFQVTITYQ